MISQLTDQQLNDFLSMYVNTNHSFYGQTYGWGHSVLQTPFLVSSTFEWGPKLAKHTRSFVNILPVAIIWWKIFSSYLILSGQTSKK